MRSGPPPTGPPNPSIDAIRLLTVAARIAIGAGGAVSAALALLPGLIAALVLLLDLGAQSVLGLSGLLIGLATGPARTASAAGGLPPYARLDRDALGAAILCSTMRALPGALLLVMAVIPRPGRIMRAVAPAIAILALVAAETMPARIACVAALCASAVLAARPPRPAWSGRLRGTAAAPTRRDTPFR